MAIKDKVVNIVLSAKDKASGAFGKLFGNLKRTSDESGKADTALGKVSRRLKAMKPAAKTSLNAVKKLGLGISALVATAGASIATLSLFSKSQARLADELTNTKNAIGVSAEALQIWQIAGDRVGLSGEKVTDILRSVTERLGEFSANGGGEAAQVMERLNLRIEDFEGLAPDQQMLRFAEAIESLPKAEQVALLEKLGSDASQLQPLLENNAAGLKAIAEESKAAGAIYSDDEIDRLLKANDVYNSIDVKLQGLTRRIGAELAPAVADATDKVIALFNQNEGGEKLAALFRRVTDWVAEATASLVKHSGTISEAVGGTLNAIKSAGQAVIEYSDSIILAAKAWLVCKAAQVAVGLVTFAQGIRTTLIPAVQEYAKSTKRATTNVGALGRAMRALPGAAILAGLTAALWAVEAASQAAGAAMADYIKTSSEGARALSENQKKVAGIARDRIAALKAEAAELERYRDVRRVTAEEAIRLSEDERATAERRLQKQLTLFQNEQRQLEYFKILGHDVSQQMADMQAAIDQTKSSMDNLANASSVSGKALESGISPAAQALVDTFESLTAGSDDASKAIEALFDGFDASNVSSVRTLVEAIGAISEKSVEAGQAIEKELRDRLDSMTGAELQRFSITLKAAFNGGSDAASRFGQIAEEVADAALRNIGTSFEELRTGISAAEREALDSFQAFTDSGARSVEDVRKVIGELQDDISSPAAVDALRDLLQSWAQQSGASIDQVEAQLEELAQNVKGTAAQVASELAAAIEGAGDQDALDGIKGQIREVWDEGAIGQERYAGLMDMVRERQQALAEESEESGDRIKESMDEAADAADRLGDSTEGAADKAGKAGEIVLSTGNFLALFFNNTTQRLLNLGEKVHDAFVKAMGMEAPARELDGLRERIESLNTEIARIRHVVPGVNVFTGWLQEVSIKSKAAERDFLLQKLAVAELLEEFERGDYSAGILNRSVDELEKRFDLLSDQDLGPLRSAIERIQGEVDSLNTSLTDTIASLRQELAGLRGDTVELEGLRYQEKRAELEERLQRARELGDQETIAAAQQALNLQEEAYRLRLADAKAQEDAERERVAREAAEEERRQQEAERQQRQRDDTEFAREERQSRQAVEAVRTININLAGETFRVLEEDEDDFVRVLENAKGVYQ